MSVVSRIVASLVIVCSITFLAGCGGNEAKQDEGKNDKDATSMQHSPNDGANEGHGG